MAQTNGQVATGAIRSAIHWKSWIERLTFYMVLLLLWNVVTSLQVWPSYVLPGPGAVFSTLLSGISSGQYLQAAQVSLQRLLIGYSVSLGIGVWLGILIGRYRIVAETIGSLVLGLQALPSVCWLPLAVVWFGLSEQAILFVVVMGAVFSITLGVENGIKNTPPVYLKAARTLGTRGLAMVTQVIIPAALPSILAGLKQGWTFAWRSLMAAELMYFSLSLGNLLNTGRDLNDASQVMAVMFTIILIGVAIDTLIFSLLERGMRERWGLLCT
jgi:NitT/TauT family transport system permease protein